MDDKEYQREYRQTHREQRIAANRLWRKRPEVMARNRIRNSDKRKRDAQARVRIRVQKGTLSRGACVFCGEPQALAHHENYDKQYEIVWVCRQHHADIHAGILTVAPDQIVDIRKTPK